MNANETLEQRLLKELGADYFLKEAPLLARFDTAKLQRRAKNEGIFRRLQKLYDPIPPVTCEPCGHVCCTASPDFYIIEYLNAWRYIRYEINDPAIENEILNRAVRWAFLSFIQENLYCPFLFDGRCIIYQARPLNCRAWGLEDDGYYSKKADRAKEHGKKQEEFFKKHNVKLLKPLSEFILPRCRAVKIHGHRLTEQQILETDMEIALLHRNLIRPEEFRTINFTLHFPGQVALKQIDPLIFDKTRVEIALELQNQGTENRLSQIINEFDGKLP